MQPKPMNRAADLCYKNPGVLLFGRFRIGGGHRWREESALGTNLDAIPFRGGSSGVARRGKICEHCAAVKFDTTDEEFAMSFLHSTDARSKAYFNQMMGRDRWGRKMDHYTRCVTTRGHPFIMHETEESITVTCNKETVARWSCGDKGWDRNGYEVWKRIHGYPVMEGEEA
ncbi:hypothetical protein RPALISO_179 [Ruegeria phage RpAliso]|nr:hypothetical protein RPALISO_179 [Ruegeria phage RpAliso]